MEKYIVEQSGPLRGEVEISGSKNAVLPLMAATLLAEGKSVICDVPGLRDVEVMAAILEALGAEVEMNPETGEIEIETGADISSEAPVDLVQKMRASILVMGPLLARTGRAVIPKSGGCAIGSRPIDLHLKGLQAMGASVEKHSDYVSVTCEKLKGARMYLDFPSVGATENLIMAASLAEGNTIIENAAQEPEIVDLASFLNRMGARVKGAGTDTIRIEGADELHPVKHYVIPDRIETGTFMLAAAITRGDLIIKNALPDHVKPITAKLIECGVKVEESDEEIHVCASGIDLIPTDIKTLPYPGFPTDIQAPFMAFLATIPGRSLVTETVFENRFMHVKELKRMGASIKVDDRKAEIRGGKPLYGARVRATDLRAGAALVLAGLTAEGKTEISEIYHIERGYANFPEKLRALGGKIEKIGE